MWRQNWSEVLRSVTLEKLPSCRNKTDSTRWKVRTCFQSYPLTSCLYLYTCIQMYKNDINIVWAVALQVCIWFFSGRFLPRRRSTLFAGTHKFCSVIASCVLPLLPEFFFPPKADNHVFLHNHSCSPGSHPWRGLQSLYRLDYPLPFPLPETLASTHGQVWQTLMAISCPHLVSLQCHSQMAGV